MASSNPRSHVPFLRDLVIGTLAVAGSTVVYYLLPLGQIGSEAGRWVFVMSFAVGLGAVAVVILAAMARYRSERRAYTSMVGLIAALYLSVLFFAAVYHGLALHEPGSIVSLHTKTDALYFAVSTTSTVGFGDVHTAGQLARSVVTVHMAFNIGFVGAALALLRPRIERLRDSQ